MGVLTSPEGTSCAVCGRSPALGYYNIGNDWFCHPDDESLPLCSSGGWKAYNKAFGEEFRRALKEKFPDYDITITDETKKKKESHS